MGDGSLVHHRAHLSAGRFHQRRFGGDFHDLLGAADLKDRIQRHYLIDFDNHILVDTLLEAFVFKIHAVAAGLHFDQDKVSVFAGLNLAGCAGGLVHHQNPDVGEYGAAGI